MADDLELNPRKMPKYETIDVGGDVTVSQPSRLRRYVLLFVAVALVAGVIAVAVASTRNAPEAPTDAGLNTAPPGTSNACSLPRGNSVRRINVGANSREFKVYVPTGTVFPASVVFAYHGIASSTDTIEGKMLIQPYQDSAAVKSIIVYPEAKNKGGGLLNPAAFNGAGCCKNDDTFNDEETFEAIVNSLVSEGCVNSDKVNVMGFSNGGFMTHRLACSTRTGPKITAGCAHSGLIGDYSGDLTRSPWNVCAGKPMMGIHGDADNTVPIGGGKNPVGPARWYSFDDTMGIWSEGCNPQSDETVGVKRTRVNKCAGHEVTSISYTGYAHDWYEESTVDCFTFFGIHGGI